MTNSLNTYPNLQYSAIQIPDFTVLEIYKESIAINNSLGYCIIPIANLSDKEIKDEIAAKAALAAHEGYSNCKIMAGRTYDNFNHKIVYAVWYNDVEPQYPEIPSDTPLNEPAAPCDIWFTKEIDNPDAALGSLSIDIECSSFEEPIEFYLNDNYYKVWVNKPVQGNNIVTVNEKGVFYNSKQIDTFEMDMPPYFDKQRNIFKIKATNALKVSYSIVYKF